MTDFDSPWKEILESHFEPFMALLFPEAHREIAWEKGYEFLDKELQQISREAEIGKRRADKLIKVWLGDGRETWILVHIEVQAQEDPGFAQRMFVYHYRIFDRYDRQVVSLGVLADEAERWRPGGFSYGLWGCELQFRYPVIKLLDYQKDPERLDNVKGNPFAVVVQAHLLALETRRDWDRRLQSKFHLVKRLYTEGYSRQQVVDLFRFIDWLMDLPEAHERLFWEELSRYEEGRKMSYVTSVERIGIEKGIQQGIQQGIRQGLLEGIELALEVKFGLHGLALMHLIRRIEEPDKLKTVKEGIKMAKDVSDLKALILELEDIQ